EVTPGTPGVLLGALLLTPGTPPPLKGVVRFQRADEFLPPGPRLTGPHDADGSATAVQIMAALRTVRAAVCLPINRATRVSQNDSSMVVRRLSTIEYYVESPDRQAPTNRWSTASGGVIANGHFVESHRMTRSNRRRYFTEAELTKLVSAARK